MKNILYAVVLSAGLILLSPAPAQARNYDCSKSGNASKAACKSAAKDASKAVTMTTSAKATAPKPVSTKVSSSTTTKTTTERNYDCSKAGNKNKATCKTAAVSPSKPIVKEATTSTASRHYDCTKLGNATKEACKVSTVTHQAPTVVRTPMARAAAAAPSVVKTAAPQPKPAPKMTAASGTEGVTATCKDGTSSHAKQHSGACSHHGGVAKWL
ncbi:MAG: hypothetical protein NVS3B5_05940 [Sphingomicrobium sp.]